MSKHWIEQYDETHHINHMWGIGIFPPTDSVSKYKPEPHNVYFVRECGFSFEFHNIEQVESCRDYYNKKIRPSTIITKGELNLYGGDQTETQRWFEKMPKKLNNNHNRPKILKALNKAIESFKNESNHTSPKTI